MRTDKVKEKNKKLLSILNELNLPYGITSLKVNKPVLCLVSASLLDYSFITHLTLCWEVVAALYIPLPECNFTFSLDSLHLIDPEKGKHISVLNVGPYIPSGMLNLWKHSIPRMT